MVFLSLSTCARNVSRVGPCGDDIYGRQRACFDICVCVCVSSFPSELWGLIHPGSVRSDFAPRPSRFFGRCVLVVPSFGVPMVNQWCPRVPAVFL